MSDIQFYEVVGVRDTPHAVALGINGRRGIVTGMAEEGGEYFYSVSIDETSYAVSRPDLLPTGERVAREAIYTGESIGVPPERYTDDDDGAVPDTGGDPEAGGSDPPAAR